MSLADDIDAAFADGATGLTVWLSPEHGYQASVRSAEGGWHVIMGHTPSEALSGAVRPFSGRQKPRRRKEDEDLI